MRFTSKLKSLIILLVLCSSTVMTLRLCIVGTFEEQCAGSFLTYCRLASISHPRLMMSLSKNFLGFFSMVTFMLNDKNLVSQRDFPIRFSFFANMYHLHIFYESLASLEQRCLLPCQKYKYQKKLQRWDNPLGNH